jgi:hypothetical protein
MAVTIGELAELCSAGGLCHHLDAEEGAIRVVFVTHDYVNARGERLAILRIEVFEGGTRCRVVLERAFATGRRAAATCLALCEATGDQHLVRIEHDQANCSLRLAAAMPVEDGAVTPRQLFSLIDGLVHAAEAGQQALTARGAVSNDSPSRAA